MVTYLLEPVEYDSVFKTVDSRGVAGASLAVRARVSRHWQQENVVVTLWFCFSNWKVEYLQLYDADAKWVEFGPNFRSAASGPPMTCANSEEVKRARFAIMFPFFVFLRTSTSLNCRTTFCWHSVH